MELTCVVGIKLPRASRHHDTQGRLFGLGWKKLPGRGEWLFERENEEQLRAELQRELPDHALEIKELSAEYVLTVSPG
jgi:hypothetical protein